jgi:hypothetical protein
VAWRADPNAKWRKVATLGELEEVARIEQVRSQIGQRELRMIYTRARRIIMDRCIWRHKHRVRRARERAYG